MEKSKHGRNESFKKKGTTLDKRYERRDRRSKEWKQLRDQTLNQNRPNMSALSPLQEIKQNDQGNKKPENRKDLLKKWRAEKELKRKLEAQEKAKNKPFKVVKSAPVELQSFKKKTVQTKGATALKPVEKPAPTRSMVKLADTATKTEMASRATRSTRVANTQAMPRKKPTTKLSEHKLTQPANARTTRTVTTTKPSRTTSKPTEKREPVSKTRATAARTSAPTTTARGNVKNEPKMSAKGATRASSRASARDAKTMAVEKEKAPEVKSILKPSKQRMDSINVERGGRFESAETDETSFAPVDFQFSAPSNLKEYFPKFTPLSPKSSAKFLMPDAVFSPPADSRRCSTPKFSVTKHPVANSPQASVIREVNSASSTDSGSDAETQHSKRGSQKSAPGTGPPVLSLKQKLADQSGSDTSRRSTRSRSQDSQSSEQSASNTIQPFTVKSVSFDIDQNDSDKEIKSKKESTRTGNNRSESIAEEMEVEEESATQDKEDDTKNSESKPEAVAESAKDAPSQSPASHSLPEELMQQTASTTQQQTKDSNKENKILDAIFKTPDAMATRGRRSRTRSLGLVLSGSAKKRTPRNNRSSLILRHLSPEEGVEVLRHSPMVEMTRRTPKASRHGTPKLAPLVLPVFDDLDDAENKLAAEETVNKQASPSDGQDMPENKLAAEETVNKQASPSDGQDMPEQSEPAVEDKPEQGEEHMDQGQEQGASQQTASEKHAATAEDDKQHTVPYFRRLLVTETGKLNQLCAAWGNVKDEHDSFPEEARGHIRTAIGKAQLLIAQRFKQFSGLVDNCEFKTGEKETTCQDLQGFWDMIYFQIEDVETLFTKLDDMKSQGWVEEKSEPVVKKVVKKKMPAKKQSKPSGRSKFAEFRTQLKRKAEEKQVENDESKTFEGGFFKVNSPVKSPMPHCEVGSSGSPAVKSARRSRTGSPLLKAAVSRSARGPSPLSKPALCDEKKTISEESVTGTPSRRSSRRSIKPTPSNEATSKEISTESTAAPSTDQPSATSAAPSITVSSSTCHEQVPEVRHDEGQHDVPYFRALLVSEAAKLQRLCDTWEPVNTSSPHLTEHVSGQIRAAIGKAQLLMAQRFKQFSGLVDNCEFKTGEKETTCQDLQGFWDMIYFQVEDVHGLFSQLDTLQQNDWQDTTTEAQPAKKIVKKKVAPLKPKAASKVKSKFASFRANLKKQNHESTENGEDIKTFEAGFFKVSSPVKSPALRNKLTPSGGSGKKAGHVTPCGNSPLHKELLVKNAFSRGPSPLLASPHTGTKRKASTDEPVVDDDPVPRKLHIADEPAEPENDCDKREAESSLFTPRAGSRRRSTRRSVIMQSAVKTLPNSESCEDLSRLLTASSQENSPAVKGVELAESDSIFTPEPAGSARRAARRSHAANDNQQAEYGLALFLEPSSKSEEDEMECEHAQSPPVEDVEMAARMKRALLQQFNAQSDLARNTPRRRSSDLPGRSTPSQSRRLSVVKSERAARRPSTPFSKHLARRSSSARRSVDVAAQSPAVTALSDTTVSSEGESPATRLAKLSVHASPASTQQPRRRRSVKDRRVSGFTPPQLISPPSRLASVKEDDDLIAFSPTPEQPTAHRQRRRSHRNRRVSGFTPPQVTGSPRAKLPSVQELDDLIAFSPLAPGTSDSNTPRRSRRSTRQSLM